MNKIKVDENILIACEEDDLKVFKELVTDINMYFVEGPLFNIACQNSSKNIILYMLKDEELDTDAQDEFYRMNNFISACSTDNRMIIEILLEHTVIKPEILKIGLSIALDHEFIEIAILILKVMNIYTEEGMVSWL